MQVRELMSTDVVTVPVDTTLDVAVEQLLGEGVGSVVVVSDDGTLLGLLTETDVLRAALESGKPLAGVPVSDVSKRPLVTTDPDTGIPTVARKMASEDVKKIPVLDDLDLVGIITLTDIVWHLSQLRQEASAMEAARDKWDPNG